MADDPQRLSWDEIKYQKARKAVRDWLLEEGDNPEYVDYRLLPMYEGLIQRIALLIP